MSAKKAAKKASIASTAVVTVTEDGKNLVHLPDGQFVKPREEGDAPAPDTTLVLVEFSRMCKVNGKEYAAGSRHEIPKNLAESLHASCSEVALG